MMWMEDAETKWKIPDIRKAHGGWDLTDAQKPAARTLYQQVADAGAVWLDGHEKNMVFFDQGGKLTVGIVDGDMILKPGEYYNAGPLTDRLGGELMVADILFKHEAGLQADAVIYHRRFVLPFIKR